MAVAPKAAAETAMVEKRILIVCVVKKRYNFLKEDKSGRGRN